MTVTLDNYRTALGLAPRGETTTDGSGRFDFGPQPAIEHAVVAAPRNGYGGMYHRVRLQNLSESPPPDALVIRLPVCARVVTGRVVHLDDTPVEAAEVAAAGQSVLGGADIPLHSVRADARGTFRICTARPSLLVSAPRLASRLVWVSDSSREPIRLYPEARVGGTVVGGDGTPIAGVVVSINSSPLFSFAVAHATPVFVARSDVQGRFEFSRLGPGAYSIGAQGEDAWVSSSFSFTPRVIVSPGQVIDDLIVRANDCGRSVAGRVLFAGQPVVGARISFGPSVLARFTEEDGGFFFSCAPDTELARFDVEGYDVVEPQDLGDEKGVLSNVIVKVVAQGGVRGRVRTADGRAAPGIRVTLQQGAISFLTPGHRYVPAQSALTSGTGEYQFSTVSSGFYEIHAVDPERRMLCPPATIGLAGGESMVAEEIVCRQGASTVPVEIRIDERSAPIDVRGVVRYDDGAPVARARIDFSLLQGAETDDVGRFFVASVPAGERRVTVTTAAGMSWSDRVVVTDDEELRLVIPRPGAVRGTIDCPDGVCDVALGVESELARLWHGEEASWLRHASVRSSFFFDAVAPGSYLVKVSGRACAARARVTVESARETRVSLRCVP